MINAQQYMTPETMLSLKKMSVTAVSPDNEFMLLRITSPDPATEKSESVYSMLHLKSNSSEILKTGDKLIFQWDENGLYAREGDLIFISTDSGKNWNEFWNAENADLVKVSPDGKFVAFSRQVQIDTVLGAEKYPSFANSTAKIFDDLGHRHWDTWSDGKYNHLFLSSVDESADNATDLLKDKRWNAPGRPFGGPTDFVWSPDSKNLVYVLKPKTGLEYMQSTNTDLFAYNLESKKTENITAGNSGYDNHPLFSADGSMLMWKSMARDGYEADKNDIMVMDWKSRKKTNLSAAWDESVTGDIHWGDFQNEIFFTAAHRGSRHLFRTDVRNDRITKVSKGNFDVNSIALVKNNKAWVLRTDINHNADLFETDLSTGAMQQLTHVNKTVYDKIKPSASELKMIDTHDGKKMGVWIHYPPDFDADKKYPVLLYCQGGPQSPLTQFFSTRWNFAVMTAKGYIVVAPNRRGMPGWGVAWNEAISRNWGGDPIQDYITAADFALTLPFTDKDRMAAIGASYGGYSVFMLAGMHQNRFATFISHNGLFDMKSWYGTTEELFFADWDAGSPTEQPLPKAYSVFNPSQHVHKWNRPIMVIQGQQDFRVPYEQGQQAFQAARLQGLKARFMYFEDENHWVLKPHNALVWQKEFFRWLEETMPGK